MYLKQIEIKNYRLLNNVTINIDKSATLIVGRNNTGKTSIMNMLCSVLNNEKLTFHDYPLAAREKLYTLLVGYALKRINYDELIKKIPSPSIKFVVDYSLESDDEFLGALSPFIIDLDVSTTTAYIFAEYRIIANEEKLDKIISLSEKGDGDKFEDSNIVKESLREEIIDNFNSLFSLEISAIDPKNSSNTQFRKIDQLRALFPLYIIRAERGLDESDNKNPTPLRSILEKLFQPDIENINLYPEVKNEIDKLRKIVKEANRELQKETNDLLSIIISKSIDFGYPNAEELQLKASTDISIDNQIKNRTDLTYVEIGSIEELPSKYNGLGYKNLIKIEFALAEFSKLIEDNNDVSIPLLFLEEPESHMHPQLQQTFVKYLEKFLKKLSDKDIQIFITTHSSHIVNTVPFNQIRYGQKKKSGVEYKDLSDFCSNDEENAKFVHKYLTLSKCDLFFADKAILIEGAAERLLIPDMIKKIYDQKLFESPSPNLPSQYYTLIEVGGAFAHKFLPFINFLEIPALIITDIDPILDGKKSLVSTGETSSNASIKSWIKKIKNIDNATPITLEQVMNLTAEEKTLNHCHIEYQTEENGLCGRSLEESIKNVNRTIFEINEEPTEEDIQFKDCKKTDFALEFITENEKYDIPDYIKNGLIWLDLQDNFSK